VELDNFYSLIPIHKEGSRPILFGIQHTGFYDLAKYLGDDQPIYALHYGISEPMDKPLPLPAMEKLVAHFIQEMRTVQSQGPYFLMGLSFGGVIAYEIAQQLVAQGQEVATIVLFDTNLEYSNQIPRPWLQRAKVLAGLNFKTIWKKTLNKLDGMTFKDIVNRLQGKKKALDMRYFPHIYNEGPIIELSKTYEPKPYQGRVDLFQAKDFILVNNIVKKPEEGWKNLVKEDNLFIHEVSGEHTTLIEEPYVENVANVLKQSMDGIMENKGLGTARHQDLVLGGGRKTTNTID
jgi:aspartate racemase